jgi:hypothetical protein
LKRFEKGLKKQTNPKPLRLLSQFTPTTQPLFSFGLFRGPAVHQLFPSLLSPTGGPQLSGSPSSSSHFFSPSLPRHSRAVRWPFLRIHRAFPVPGFQSGQSRTLKHGSHLSLNSPSVTPFKAPFDFELKPSPPALPLPLMANWLPASPLPYSFAL